MSPAEAEAKNAFEEDDELDDSEGDDTDIEDDLEEEDDDEEDEEEEEFPYVSPPPLPQPSRLPKQEPNSPLTSSNPNPNPNPNPSPARAAPQNGSIKAVPISTSEIFTPPAAHAADDSRRVVSATSIEDSRRLFQRLWTDEDEITILQGFLEFTTQRGTTHASHQYDTGPFYEQIKKQLPLEFNKNQLIEKLRRLKKKYRNVVSRMVSGKEFSFKSAHEQATFEIARKIWSANVKRGRDSEDDEFAPNPASAIVEFDSGFGVGVGVGVGAVAADGSLSSERKMSRSSRRRIRMRNSEHEIAAEAVAVEVPITAPLDPPLPVPIPSIIEETVKSCLSPLFKELLQSAMVGPQAGFVSGIGGLGCGGLLGMNPLQLGFGNLQGNLPVDEKWRNQNILELEVYLKRIELMRDQIRSTLEELKSSNLSAGD